jgi:hypothetical protein
MGEIPQVLVVDMPVFPVGAPKEIGGVDRVSGTLGLYCGYVN